MVISGPGGTVPGYSKAVAVGFFQWLGRQGEVLAVGLGGKGPASQDQAVLGVPDKAFSRRGP